jgi:hypothetical protein
VEELKHSLKLQGFYDEEDWVVVKPLEGQWLPLFSDRPFILVHQGFEVWAELQIKGMCLDENNATIAKSQVINRRFKFSTQVGASAWPEREY